MRIHTIEITNYKAFLGSYKIAVGGKNVFIYGENGSGKSSLYYALKDFFQSSIEDIDLGQLENIFVPARKAGKTAIKVSFKPNHQGQKKKQDYLFNASTNDSRVANDTSIRDGNKLKSFLTYKHLLGIHHLKQTDEINLFDLLVNGVLKHFKYSLTNGKELGELWADIVTLIDKPTGKQYTINKKKSEVNTALKVFNDAFGELFKAGSPENILTHTKPILEKFKHNLELSLHFPGLRPNTDYTAIENAKVGITLAYCGKQVGKPHLFLNEARLSAIAISIYLGMIKRHIQGIPCKVLFLDDIFIGLDIANRLPLLLILEQEFPDYQIFITTYDKPWFEHVKSFLEQNANWKTLEFYAKASADGVEIPLIEDEQGFITKAEKHFAQCDYKASAVYARSAFEKMIRKYCEKKKLKVAFKTRLKDYTTEDFWNVIKGGLPQQVRNDIETYRSLVLNAFSHYNTERHEIKTELDGAIKAVKALQTELNKS